MSSTLAWVNDPRFSYLVEPEIAQKQVKPLRGSRLTASETRQAKPVRASYTLLTPDERRRYHARAMAKYYARRKA